MLNLIFTFLFAFHAKAYVDLHNHLFMEEALPSFLYQGCFECPLGADSWKSKWGSKSNEELLLKSKLKIVVVALYAQPIFMGDMRESVRRQIKKAEAFVKRNPDWIIARTATEARVAIRQNKRVIVFSLEGASGIIESDADIKEFTDQLGIRIVAPLHFADDKIGAAAFLSGNFTRILVNPIAFLKSIFDAHFDEYGARVNAHSLTEHGRELVYKLTRNKVWIDFAHASDLSQNEMWQIVSDAKQPRLYTHTTLREFLKSERAITKAQIESVKASKGLVGLLPMHDMLEGTTIDGMNDACTAGVGAAYVQWQKMAALIGEDRLVIGSDLNAPAEGLSDGCPSTPMLQQQGWWNINHIEELWDYMRSKAYQGDGVESFLSAWEMVNP